MEDRHYRRNRPSSPPRGYSGQDPLRQAGGQYDNRGYYPDDRDPYLGYNTHADYRGGVSGNGYDSYRGDSGGERGRHRVYGESEGYGRQHDSSYSSKERGYGNEYSMGGDRYLYDMDRHTSSYRDESIEDCPDYDSQDGDGQNDASRPSKERPSGNINGGGYMGDPLQSMDNNQNTDVKPLSLQAAEHSNISQHGIENESFQTKLENPPIIRRRPLSVHNPEDINGAHHIRNRFNPAIVAEILGTDASQNDNLLRSPSVKVGGLSRKSVRESRVPAEEEDYQGLIDEQRRKKYPRKKFGAEIAYEKSRILASPTSKISGYEKWKLDRLKEWERNKRRVKEAFSSLGVWHSSFKIIEGNFGSSVVAYFNFLRWLFFINLFITIVILGVIVFPQTFMEPTSFNASVQEAYLYPNDPNLQNVLRAINCSDLYAEALEQGNTTKTALLYIIDFFQGTGFMEDTYLFIGHYYNKSTYLHPKEAHYDMPLGYLLATICYMIIILIVMVLYTAKGMKTNLSSQGEQINHVFTKVFCAWDYSLFGETAASLKQKNLYQDFRNTIAELKRKEALTRKTKTQRALTYLKRFVAHFITICVLVLSAALIYYVVVVFLPLWLDSARVKASPVLNLFVEFMPSFTITGLNLIVPLFFYKLVLMEDYSPNGEIVANISRIVLLRLASLVVLAFSLTQQITDDECKDDPCGHCHNIKGCWETYVGQQLYKLVVLNIIVVIIVTFLVEYPRGAITRKFPENKLIKLVGPPEFDIPKNVLDIVYAQTLSWWGGFYCPFIPIMTVVSFFMIFYFKKWSTLYNFVPNTRPYRQSKSNHFFMIVLMVSFALVFVVLSYHVGKVPPSRGCSPFRIYEGEDYFMYKNISNGIRQLHHVLRDILFFIGSWIFFTVMFILLGLLTYYHVAVTSGNKKMVELLKEQLAIQGRDKKFLLDQVNEALQRGAFK